MNNNMYFYATIALGALTVWSGLRGIVEPESPFRPFTETTAIASALMVYPLLAVTMPGR